MQLASHLHLASIFITSTSSMFTCPVVLQRETGQNAQVAILVTPEKMLSNHFHLLRITSLGFVWVPTSCSWLWHRNKERRFPMLKALCDSQTHFLPTP